MTASENELVEKWERTGLLDNITNARKKLRTAKKLERLAQQILGCADLLQQPGALFEENIAKMRANGDFED
jgi:hypothetical protein